ncbi:sugar kinase [Bradyrhizobium sp. 2TAF24]|uniref:sugar kinase n=1 Tax=Bradyrhizobium sp. 2TAF24 TaxID=3233011 RepID=UPI003F9147A1
MKIACIGECMIELTEAAGGHLARGYGGDTLNTATYLARLGVTVDYVTALGDDPWSDEMVAGWRTEGIGTSHVARLAGKLPGLYVIETNAAGERRFHYWRDSSAARSLLDLPQTGAILAALAGYDVVYLSGVTLSLYDVAGRTRLMRALDDVRKAGRRVAFDTNFRPRGWPDRALAQRTYHEMFEGSDIVLASVEDLDLLFGAGRGAAVADGLQVPELVLKLAEPASRVRTAGIDQMVRAAPVTRVVDTTAAGDSYSAAYLAARIGGADPVAAARAGHDLAGIVVGYPGALIPRAAMPAQTPVIQRRITTA